jgi:predicted regulator of Ras-like GTPase activity (Roadblock/LC7/MglB family)
MFKEKLSQVVSHVDGTLGCLLIGFDGIPIETLYTGDEIPQMDEVAVELSNLLGKFRRLESTYEMGGVDEVAVTIGNITALAHVVGEEYLLMLALNSEGDVDRGQNMLRLIAPAVEREIQ